MPRLILLVAAVLLMSGGMRAVELQAPQTPNASAPVGNADNGRRVFMEQTCYYCHGTEGQGGLAAVGPRIALVPRGLDSFMSYVREPAGRMSAYSEQVLSDQDLRDIYAYLRAQPAAKPAKELPLLEQLRKPGGP